MSQTPRLFLVLIVLHASFFHFLLLLALVHEQISYAVDDDDSDFEKEPKVNRGAGGLEGKKDSTPKTESVKKKVASEKKKVASLAPGIRSTRVRKQISYAENSDSDFE